MVNVHPDRRINLTWNGFLEKYSLPESTKLARIFSFSDDMQESVRLLRLAYKGEKDVIFTSFNSYSDAFDIPMPGDYSIVTDSAGFPYCVIYTKAVDIVPFKSIDLETAKRFDTADNLLTWQLKYMHKFSEESNSIGYNFSMESPMVFEEFEIKYWDMWKLD